MKVRLFFAFHPTGPSMDDYAYEISKKINDWLALNEAAIEVVDIRHMVGEFLVVMITYKEIDSTEK